MQGNKSPLCSLVRAKGLDRKAYYIFNTHLPIAMAVRQATRVLDDILSNLHVSSLSRLLLILAENLYPGRRPRFSREEQRPHWWPTEVTYTHPYKMTKKGQCTKKEAFRVEN